MEKTLISFKRNGLALPEETREKVKKLQVELNNLRVKFSKNLNEDKGFVLFSKEELEGIPKTLLTSTKRLMANSKLHSSILIFSLFLNMLGTLTQEKLQILRTETDVQKTILF